MELDRSAIDSAKLLGTAIAVFGIGQAATTASWKIALEVCGLIYVIFAVTVYFSKTNEQKPVQNS